MNSVIQTGDKMTAVTLNELDGTITMAPSRLMPGQPAAFILYNSQVAETDVATVIIKSGASYGKYGVGIDALGHGMIVIRLSNQSDAPLSEAVMLNFMVHKPKPGMGPKPAPLPAP